MIKKVKIILLLASCRMFVKKYLNLQSFIQLDMATKKVKKVEVPIDERETFVSLQKNFAEGEDRVEEKLKLLYQLQKADSEIDKIIQLRGELPAEVEELEADIAALRTQSADISAFIIALNQSISDNKQNILDCDDQIAKYQGQLQGVTNSREFDSINKEIENQNLLRQIAEKNIYETKAKVVEKKDELEDVKARFAARNEDLKLKKQELDKCAVSYLLAVEPCRDNTGVVHDQQVTFSEVVA